MSEFEFAVHAITVTSVSYDDPGDEYGIEPTECSFEIDHGKCTDRGDDCLVEQTVRELGLHAALFGVFDVDHRVEQRSYRVLGWVQKYDVPGEPVEYDAGISVLDEDV